MVATRASRRSCDASATDSSLDRSFVVVGSTAVATLPQSRCGSAYPVYARMKSLDFSQEELERAARYHRPRYFSLFVDLVLSVAVLAVLQWGWAGPWRLAAGSGWAGSAAAYAAIVSLALLVVHLPVAFWR